MSLVSEETKTAPVETARRLADLFAEGAAERDRERRFPHAELAELKRSGLLALRVPAEFGGVGADVRELLRVLAALAAGDPNIAQMYHVHSYGVELLNGVHDQAPRSVLEGYYRRLVDDGHMITNAFSEVGTKTVFDYQVRLRMHEDGNWRLTGRKFYCTGSLGGDLLYVLGLTEDEEPRFLMGLVDIPAPGLTILDDWTGMGQKTTASGTIIFENVVIPPEICFDLAPFNTETSLFGSFGQCMFAAIYAGIARGALQDAVGYVRTRARPWPHSGVETATQDPYVLYHLGRMRTLVSSAESMLERAADVREEAEATPTVETRDRASVAAAETKVLCGEAALRVSELLFRVCGAGSVLEKYNFDRHWRNARTLTLHNPSDYNLRLSGNYLLNDESPPVSAYT